MRRFGRAVALLAALAALPALGQTVEERRLAVEGTLAGAPACAELGDLYWEIGNAEGPQAWGRRGHSIAADRPMPIASASKWLFGAFVVERNHGTVSADEIAALTMTSGRTGLRPLGCRGRVADCLPPGPDAGKIGRFAYDGGHDQALAAAYGFGALDGPGLAAEMRKVLGHGLDFTFRSPQPAGGIIMSPAAYGTFLRLLAGGKLMLSDQLGRHAVCTLPGTCPTALHSPAPKNWHYSLNHWVEDSPGDDGVFSSAGAFGFYPWLAADRSTYGILARQQMAPGAGIASAACGALMRKAWSSAVPQAGTAPETPPRRHPLRELLRQRAR